MINRSKNEKKKIALPNFRRQGEEREKFKSYALTAVR
jgi:hypothetical protein